MGRGRSVLRNWRQHIDDKLEHHGTTFDVYSLTTGTTTGRQKSLVTPQASKSVGHGVDVDLPKHERSSVNDDPIFHYDAFASYTIRNIILGILEPSLEMYDATVDREGIVGENHQACNVFVNSTSKLLVFSYERDPAVKENLPFIFRCNLYGNMDYPPTCILHMAPSSFCVF